MNFLIRLRLCYPTCGCCRTHQYPSFARSAQTCCDRSNPLWLMGGVFVVDFLCLSALSSPRTLLSLLSLKSLLSSRHQKRNLEHFASRQKWRVTCRFFADFWMLNAKLFRSRGRHRWCENIFRLKKLNFRAIFYNFVGCKVKYKFHSPTNIRSNLSAKLTRRAVQKERIGTIDRSKLGENRRRLRKFCALSSGAKRSILGVCEHLRRK